jgi:hypothetical protein
MRVLLRNGSLNGVLCAGALEEVDWLRNKLETLEKALKESIPGIPGVPAALLGPDSLAIPESAAEEGSTPGGTEK